MDLVAHTHKARLLGYYTWDLEVWAECPNLRGINAWKRSALEKLTVDRKAHEYKYANLHRKDIQKEVTQVVCPNAIIDPWTMAFIVSREKMQLLLSSNSLVLLGYASRTLLAMLAANRYTSHAVNTKTVIVKFPHANELVDDGFLLDTAAKFRDITGIFGHAENVKICTKTKRDGEEEVQDWMRVRCRYIEHVSYV